MSNNHIKQHIRRELQLFPPKPIPSAVIPVQVNGNSIILALQALSSEVIPGNSPLHPTSDFTPYFLGSTLHIDPEFEDLAYLLLPLCPSHHHGFLDYFKRTLKLASSFYTAPFTICFQHRIKNDQAKSDHDTHLFKTLQ